jgi:hypothetical protein
MAFCNQLLVHAGIVPLMSMFLALGEDCVEEKQAYQHSD